MVSIAFGIGLTTVGLLRLLQQTRLVGVKTGELSKQQNVVQRSELWLTRP